MRGPSSSSTSSTAYGVSSLKAGPGRAVDDAVAVDPAAAARGPVLEPLGAADPADALLVVLHVPRRRGNAAAAVGRRAVRPRTPRCRRRRPAAASPARRRVHALIIRASRRCRGSSSPSSRSRRRGCARGRARRPRPGARRTRRAAGGSISSKWNSEPGMPECANESRPPCVLHGIAPPYVIWPSATKRPPSPFGQKPRSSSIMIDGAGEAVVDAGDVDVGAACSRPSRTPCGSTARRRSSSATASGRCARACSTRRRRGCRPASRCRARAPARPT